LVFRITCQSKKTRKGNQPEVSKTPGGEGVRTTLEGGGEGERSQKNTQSSVVQKRGKEKEKGSLKERLHLIKQKGKAFNRAIDGLPPYTGRGEKLVVMERGGVNSLHRKRRHWTSWGFYRLDSLKSLFHWRNVLTGGWETDCPSLVLAGTKEKKNLPVGSRGQLHLHPPEVQSLWKGKMT